MDVHRLAGEAEAYCRENQLPPLRATLETLAGALNRLGAAADGILDMPAPAADDNPSPATDAATVARIRRLLAANDLEAVLLVKSEAAGLRSLIGRDGYARLQDAVEELDFEKALALLSEV